MKITSFTLLFCFAFLAETQSQDLTYAPKNPAFGGPTFNYQWMLSSAQAQNSLVDPNKTPTRVEKSSIDQFTESLNRQLLSRLSRQLLNDQFGENGIQEGILQFGDFQIDITQDIGGMVITIYDGQGGETRIEVPFP
jgi:curli production assembly/transport component CsgF